MEVSKLFVSVVLFMLLGVGIYYGWKLMRVAAKVFTEMLVMYRVLTGESCYHDTKPPLRLYIYACSTQYLDEVTISEIYHFLLGSLVSELGGKDQTISALHKVLLSYSHITLFRDKIDGSLRGVMAVNFERKKEYTVMKMGLTFFKNSYQGGPISYLAMEYFIFKEMILHPLTPVYVIGKAYGYRAYLVTTHFKESYPRYDKETPKLWKKMFREFAQGVMAEGDTYDEETSVLKQERTHLNEELSTVTEQALQNPHIRFFVEQNPGFRKGHCLVSGWRMTWSDLPTVLGLIFRKSFQRTRSKKNGPTFGRNNGKKTHFQEASINANAVNMYQVDLGRESTPSPTSKGSFIFGALSPTGSPLSSSNLSHS